MPINLERPLIKSNLDSYLGEAGTGAGLDVPGMPMRQPRWSTGAAEAALLLTSSVLSPSEEGTKSPEAGLLRGTDDSRNLIFVPAMTLKRLRPFNGLFH